MEKKKRSHIGGKKIDKNILTITIHKFQSIFTLGKMGVISGFIIFIYCFNLHSESVFKIADIAF